jgi:hypothetical protein
MRTDLYTKIVLTVIAIALVANFFKNNDVISSAYASQNNQIQALPAQKEVIDVNIVSVSKPIDVNLMQYGGTSINGYNEYSIEKYFGYRGNYLNGIPILISK